MKTGFFGNYLKIITLSKYTKIALAARVDIDHQILKIRIISTKNGKVPHQICKKKRKSLQHESKKLP